MGWVWRKVFRFGPFRTTLSTRGWGWSIGSPFFRYGIGRAAVAIFRSVFPGTGLYFTKFLGRGVRPIVPTAPVQITQQSPTPGPSVPPVPSHLSANQKILEAYKNKSSP